MRRPSPRLAIGQMQRWERDAVEAALAERRLALVDHADPGPAQETTIAAAE